MEGLEKLLQLPYQTLAILVAGYLGYRLAYVGRDSTHRTIDTAAIALVFAFIAQAGSAGLLAIYKWNLSPNPSDSLPLWIGYGISIGGIIVAQIAAAIWRRVSVKSVPDLLRNAGVSSSDRNLAAWQTIIDDENSGPSSITLVKKDGTTVMCERLDDFRDAPFGPMILGQDGSIALYVTASRIAGSSDWIETDPNYADWGPEITIIQAAEISEVRMRHSPSLLRRWRRRRRTGNGTGIVRDKDATGCD